jgi:hypothetical protein
MHRGPQEHGTAVALSGDRILPNIHQKTSRTIKKQEFSVKFAQGVESTFKPFHEILIGQCTRVNEQRGL